MVMVVRRAERLTLSYSLHPVHLLPELTNGKSILVVPVSLRYFNNMFPALYSSFMTLKPIY
jgi:hypothetical protein